MISQIDNRISEGRVPGRVACQLLDSDLPGGIVVISREGFEAGIEEI